MTFFENNRERVRTHLMKFLYSDDEDGADIHGTDGDNDTIHDDTIHDDAIHDDAIHDDAIHEDVIHDNEKRERENSSSKRNIHESRVQDTELYDDNYDDKNKFISASDALSNQDSVHTSSDYEDMSDDDIYDVSEQDVLDMIRTQKNELHRLKSVFHPTESDDDDSPKPDLSDEYESDTLSVDTVDTVDLIENDIDQSLLDNDLSSSGAFTHIGSKPYKISIPVSSSEDYDFNDDDDEHDDNTIEDDSDFSDSSISSQRDSPYVEFDAFYEHYVAHHKLDRQFQLFNDMHIEALVDTTKPTIANAVQTFVGEIETSWVRIFEQGLRHYGITITDPPKWISRAGTLVYDMHLKLPLLEYLKHVGNLLVLFDTRDTFGINESLYVDIHHKAIEPIDMRKYLLTDMMETFMRGRSISSVLIQDMIQSIRLKQNATILSLSIKLYNKITGSNLQSLLKTAIVTNDVQIRRRLKQEQKTQFAKPRRPMIYVDDKHVYLFDYRQLNDEFGKGNYVNPYSKQPFDPIFVEKCKERSFGHMLCAFCKSRMDADNSLKTIYHDAKYGPVIMKFCSVDCFMDMEWKPKVLRNVLSVIL
jgi:hypothetical protein